MNQYRDFDNDPITYNYTTGQEFLARLHASGRHYVPIVDSAIYVPNPNNASDAYALPVSIAPGPSLTDSNQVPDLQQG